MPVKSLIITPVYLYQYVYMSLSTDIYLNTYVCIVIRDAKNNQCVKKCL
jgi:hypothetical protein